MKKLIIPLLLAVLWAGCSKGDDWSGESIIPVTLKGIEAVNIDNSGEFPKISDEPIGKNCYMIGIKWEVDNLPDDDDAFVGGPIYQGERTYSSVANGYSKRVRSLTKFNEDIKPEEGEDGTIIYPNISPYFMEADRAFLPEGIDEGLILLEMPDAGTHRFRVEYWRNGSRAFYYDTPAITLR